MVACQLTKWKWDQFTAVHSVSQARIWTRSVSYSVTILFRTVWQTCLWQPACLSHIVNTFFRTFAFCLPDLECWLASKLFIFILFVCLLLKWCFKKYKKNVTIRSELQYIIHSTDISLMIDIYTILKIQINQVTVFKDSSHEGLVRVSQCTHTQRQPGHIPAGQREKTKANCVTLNEPDSFVKLDGFLPDESEFSNSASFLKPPAWDAQRSASEGRPALKSPQVCFWLMWNLSRPRMRGWWRQLI